MYPVQYPGSEKKLLAGILGIVLGAFGVHKFVLGYTNAGIAMLLITLLTCGLAAPIMHVIGIIEGIIYLTRTDPEFVNTYVYSRKEWF
jgi:TM2 domain-containing membrane protein YozV